MSKPEGYRSPGATLMAISSAAKAAAPALGVPVQHLEQLLLFNRLLVRVFQNPGGPFVLKGGTRMLAYIPQARATRDIDLETSLPLDEAVKQLRTLCAADMGDRLRFDLVGRRDGGGDDQPNIAVTTLTFEATGTGRRVKIDLAAYQRAGAAVVLEAPRFRVDLPRPLPEADYVMIRVEQQIADKVAATMERRHAGGDGRSSRAKDLVDLALIALHLPCDARLLAEAIARQMEERSLNPFAAIDTPKMMQRGYQAAAKNTAVEYMSWQDAETLTNSLVGPILDGTVSAGTWDPHRCKWT